MFCHLSSFVVLGALPVLLDFSVASVNQYTISLNRQWSSHDECRTGPEICDA